MKELKSIAHDWVPPAFVRWFRQLSGGGIRFEGEFSTWEEAATHCTGYNDQGILAKVLEATLKVKRSEAVFERDSVLFSEIEYSWPVLAGLMWAAARNGGKLNVLDFGGALGSSYFQNRKFLHTLADVRWNVVEQANFVAAGQKYIQDVQFRFYQTINECLNENQSNVVLLSAVLQYLPDPYAVLADLLETKPKVLIIDRTCYLKNGGKEVIKIQHVPSSIYSASYPCRFFLEHDLCRRIAEHGYSLVESFDSLDKLGHSAVWKGHIFLIGRDD